MIFLQELWYVCPVHLSNLKILSAQLYTFRPKFVALREAINGSNQSMGVTIYRAIVSTHSNCDSYRNYLSFTEQTIKTRYSLVTSILRSTIVSLKIVHDFLFNTKMICLKELLWFKFIAIFSAQLCKIWSSCGTERVPFVFLSTLEMFFDCFWSPFFFVILIGS